MASASGASLPGEELSEAAADSQEGGPPSPLAPSGDPASQQVGQSHTAVLPAETTSVWGLQPVGLGVISILQ